MLVKLLADQIVKYWKVIKYSLEHTFPEGTKNPGEKLNYALEELLLDKNMHAWLCVREKGDDMDYDILGCAVTSVVVEVGTKVTMLRILCLFAFEDVPAREWKEGSLVLKRFANSIGCDAIDGFTNISSVIDFAKSIGGDTSRTYIQVGLKE
jgi:hypothetical protein